MTTQDPQWRDEELHAYVDGELDAARAARLEAGLAQDAALAARVARQRRLRAALQARFDTVLDEPVPQRLQQTLAGMEDNVTPIGNAAGKRARPAPLWWGALAASVLLGVLLGWNMPRDTGLPFASGAHGLVASGKLDAALSRQLASDGAGASGVVVALSFRADDGRYCRSFSLNNGVDGLACRGEEQWQVEAVGMGAARDGSPAADSYRQAGSALSRTVLDAISARQAGDTLAASEEAQLRARGWRAAPAR